MIDNGFTFNTNCFHEEQPYLWEKNGKVMVELPRQPFGDGTLFGHRHGEFGNPFFGLEVWKAYFDEMWAESAASPKYIPFTCHPYIIGRPGRTLALRGIIQHMKKTAGDKIWFATGPRVVRLVPQHGVQVRMQRHSPCRRAQARPRPRGGRVEEWGQTLGSDPTHPRILRVKKPDYPPSSG